MVTLINAEKLRRELYFHPDQTQVDYVISGLSNGFQSRFQPSGSILKACKTWNLRKAVSQSPSP